jgi:hypothetical protein
MKRFLSPFAILAVVTPLASAHIGSPNVFFEGRAGAYSIYAVIRPPAALPGAAQVSVRVQEADIRSVSLLPVMWQAGRKGSPPPVAAQRVPGETNLWSAEVWFLRPGSYTVQVSVEGSRGIGEATVPVNAVGMQSQQMKSGLRATLSLFGLLLLVSAGFIVGAVTRDGGLEPGAQPAARQRAHARWASGTAALLLVAGVAAGAVRWRNMDFAYRTQGMQKPEPIIAVVRTDVDRVILELRQSEQSTSLPSWAAMVPDHGKLMHLFLIREPALDVFAHLHPVRTDARTFALEAPALPAGGYQLYGDVTFENGISQTLVARVTLPETFGATLAPSPLATNLTGEVICGFPSASGTNNGPVIRDMDDSWHVGQAAPTGFANRTTVKHLRGGLVSRLMGGHTLLFENADAVRSGRETSLRFAAFAPDGTEAALQPYMGMLGHAAVRRADGSVFAHLHPLGSFSMASQEVFRQREGAIGIANERTMALSSFEKSPTNRVSFPYQFPKAGPYRLWVQVLIAGRVFTGVYDVDIKAGG